MSIKNSSKLGTGVLSVSGAISQGVSWGVATGGTSSTITVDGESYTLLEFTSSSTLTVTKPGFFEVLPISGGGGGDTGGGGGGGIARGEALASTVSKGIVAYFTTDVPVVVGAGGPSRSGGGGTAPQRSGGMSHVGYVSAEGGGLASTYGGCGGGENSAPPQYDNMGRSNGYHGYDGGNAVYNTGTGDYHSGGGGGGGAVGGNALENAGNNSRGGHGGAGADISAFLGQSAGTTYVSGGGGGQAYDTGHNGGNGGTGGGGRGWGKSGGAVAGSANTGGGGGGGRASGGSGRVYVRFKN